MGDATNVLVSLNGRVYVAPVGTPGPTNATSSLNAAFVELGFMSGDGATLRESEDFAHVAKWNSPNISRKIPLKRTMTVEFVLREWNKRAVEFSTEGTVSPNSGEWKLAPPSTGTEKSLVLEWEDGSKKYRLYIPRGYVTETVDSTMSRVLSSDLPVTFTGVSTGGSIYELFTNDTSFQGTGVVERSAALSATANVAATSLSLLLGQASLSATAEIASISQGGTNEFLRQAALSVTALIDSSGSNVTAFARAVALAATAEIVNTGVIRYAWSEPNAATTQTGTGVYERSAALSATADVSAAHRIFMLRQAALDVTTSIDATGRIGGTLVTSSIDLSATADVSAVGQTELAGGQAIDDARVTTSVDSALTSHTVTLPTGIVSGCLVIIVGRIPSARTTTWPAGWQSYLNDGVRNWHDVDLDAGDDRITAVYRQCDGSEGASITVGLDVAEKGAYVAYRIHGQRNVSAQVPEISSAIGNSLNPDPPLITPTGGSKNYLILALDTHVGEQTAAVNYPAGYENQGQVTTGIGGTTADNCQINFASRQVTGATEDPAAYTISGAQPWTALTIAIHPGTVTGITAAVEATGDISAVGQRDVLGQVALSATSNIATNGQVATGGTTTARTVALDATADIASAPFKIAMRQASLDATAGIIAVGQPFTFTRQAALSGTADIVVAGARVKLGQAAISATAAADVASVTVTHDFFADTSDGYIRSFDAASYTVARGSNGTRTVFNVDSHLLIGQQGNIIDGWNVYEVFLAFNTAAIPDTATVTAAVLSLPGVFDFSTTDFTMEAYAEDWGSGLQTGDWVSGSSIGNRTLLATYALASGFTNNGGYNAFTSQAAFSAAVVKLSTVQNGRTRLLVSSDYTRLGIQTDVDSFVDMYSADNSGSKPKLTVTWAPSAVSPDANVTAGDVGALTTVPTPTVTADVNANVTAGDVAAVAAVPTPTVTADANVTAGDVGALTTVPTPTVTATGGGGAQGGTLWFWGVS